MYRIEKSTIASELIIEAVEMKGKRPTELNFKELIDVVESVVKKLIIPSVVRPNLTNKHPIEGVNETMRISDDFDDRQLCDHAWKKHNESDTIMYCSKCWASR